MKNELKVLVLGSPGSGKTTFSKILSQNLDIPNKSIDDLYWQGLWERPRDTDFENRLIAFLQTDCWILDGNFLDCLSTRMKYCTHIIFLDVHPLICSSRFLKRQFKRFLGLDANLPKSIGASRCNTKYLNVSLLIRKILFFRRKIGKRTLNQIENNLSSNQKILVMKRASLDKVLRWLEEVS